MGKHKNKSDERKNDTTEIKTTVFKSSYGYTIELFDEWLPITKEFAAQNPDMFNPNHPDFIKLDSSLQKKVLQRIQSGNYDFILKYKNSNKKFPATINVSKHIGLIPKNQNELTKLCTDLMVIYKNKAEKKLNIYGQSFKKIDGKNAVYLEFDGLVQNTRTIHYMVSLGNNEYISFTVNYSIDISPDGSKWIDMNLLAEINAIISSIKLK